MIAKVDNWVIKTNEQILLYEREKEQRADEKRRTKARLSAIKDEHKILIIDVENSLRATNELLKNCKSISPLFI